MKLIKARIQNYRSIDDSGEFDIGDITCFVGKNEAGKTALLSALRSLRPSSSQPFSLDQTRDYPRRFLARFSERHPDGKAEVIRVRWKLEDTDRKAVAEKFGSEALKSDEFQVHYGFGFDNHYWEIEVDEHKCLKYLISKHGLGETEYNLLQDISTGKQASDKLSTISGRTQKQEALLQELKEIRGSNFTSGIIDILVKRQPHFFFTSHFERMSGEISLEQLERDQRNKEVSVGDRIFLAFLEYAGVTIEGLAQIEHREELLAKCEAASNEITGEILQFWSQNEALEIVIEVGTGGPKDPAPFNNGIVVDIRIKNTIHKVTLPLSERSAGFVWFFSFLAQFKQLKKTENNAIILLDEPGLTLHGKAQNDLLRYISERLLPDHQVIFTTHSPFMVPMERLQDVRIVEDVISRDDKTRKIDIKGTKVSSDILKVSDDTLFPLQAALGYEVTQSMFIGAHVWLVEGPSDILYLQILSQSLRKRGREGIDKRWVLCPSGGIDKIAPFVRLFRGNNIDIAVLSDIAKSDRKKIDTLKKEQILQEGHFFTVADFVNQQEADIEDIFDAEIYATILNRAYNNIPEDKRISKESLLRADTTERIVKKAEALFRLMPPEIPEFDHFTPSRWLFEHAQLLDEDNIAVKETLNRAEAIFKTFNKLLSTR